MEDDAQESGGWKMTHRKVEGRRKKEQIQGP